MGRIPWRKRDDDAAKRRCRDVDRPGSTSLFLTSRYSFLIRAMRELDAAVTTTRRAMFYTSSSSSNSTSSFASLYSSSGRRGRFDFSGSSASAWRTRAARRRLSSCHGEETSSTSSLSALSNSLRSRIGSSFILDGDTRLDHAGDVDDRACLSRSRFIW